MDRSICDKCDHQPIADDGDWCYMFGENPPWTRCGCFKPINLPRIVMLAPAPAVSSPGLVEE